MFSPQGQEQKGSKAAIYISVADLLNDGMAVHITRDLFLR